MALGEVNFLVDLKFTVVFLIARSLNGLLIQIISVQGFRHQMLWEGETLVGTHQIVKAKDQGRVVGRG